jgi:hypothetical protein
MRNDRAPYKWQPVSRRPTRRYSTMSSSPQLVASSRCSTITGAFPKVNGTTKSQRGLAHAFAKSFHPARSGDILVATKPFYFWGKHGERDAGSSHGSPYEYDTHVPLILVGSTIRQGTFDQLVDMADLAPTLATILGIGAPSGNEGRTLHEILRSSE